MCYTRMVSAENIVGWIQDPNCQRWWDGANWTSQTRTVGEAAPDGHRIDGSAGAYAGWYQDQFSLRWWNGEAWTDQVQSTWTSTPSVAVGVGVATSARKYSFLRWRRLWPVMAVASTVLGGIATAGWVASQSGGSTQFSPKPATTVVTEVAPRQLRQPTTTTVRAATTTTSVPATVADLPIDSARRYGDNSYLDALYDRCQNGDNAACDTLYWDSRVDTAYEAFGSGCGGRGPGYGSCADSSSSGGSSGVRTDPDNEVTTDWRSLTYAMQLDLCVAWSVTEDSNFEALLISQGWSNQYAAAMIELLWAEC